MVGKGRKYDLQMKCAPLENLGQYDCVLIVTDHSDYDYKRIVRESQLVVDTRNATKGIDSPENRTLLGGLEENLWDLRLAALLGHRLLSSPVYLFFPPDCDSESLVHVHAFVAHGQLALSYVLPLDDVTRRRYPFRMELDVCDWSRRTRNLHPARNRRCPGFVHQEQHVVSGRRDV